MNVKLYRHSGRPIEISDQEKLTAEWQLLFDRILERAGQTLDDKTHRLSKRDPQYLISRYASFTERLLRAKYEKYIMVKLPINAKQWKTLVDKWGPIMAAREQVTNNIILVIADQLS